MTNVIGRLEILSNPLLTNVSGLEALSSLSDGINVVNNASLTDFSGFQSLSYVGTYLRVVENQSLISIEAFNKITSVSEFLSVGNNLLLESLSGLHNITTAHEVAIGGNSNLLSLDGLKSLTTTSGYVYVGYNPKLTSLQGLNKLKQIGNYLNIVENGELTTLDGLDVLESVQTYVQLQYNAKLSTCAVPGICFILRANSNVSVIGNASGCSTLPEISDKCSSLPVELVSFSGENNAEGNLLKWVTVSETGNKGFEVESSHNGKLFKNIGFVAGNSDSKQELRYSFTHQSNLPVTYYRLKQIDWDGTSAYSQIIAVKRKSGTVSVYPNPSRGRLFIGAKNRNQAYKMTNSQGVVVKASSAIPDDGIATTSLQDGLYYITVGTEVFKVLVDND